MCNCGLPGGRRMLLLLPHTRFTPDASVLSSGASRLAARFAGRSGERPLSALVGLDLGRVGGGEVVFSIALARRGLSQRGGELLVRRRR